MSKNTDGTFWSHVEVFRWVIIRCFVVVIAIAIVAFIFKDFVFGDIILAPCHNNFISYKALRHLGQLVGIQSLCPNMQDIKMININLAAQLFTHISISFYIGLILAFPYLMIELWMFVSPALYKKEKKPAIKGIFTFAILFFIGLLLAYYVIFPLTLNFLGTYQVSVDVINQISLNSYINTFLTLLFMMGLVFELPIVAYFFAKIGLLTSSFLSKNRKYAFVIILIAAALITPSTDIFTMMLVAIPLQLLYESSLMVVRKVEHKRNKFKRI